MNTLPEIVLAIFVLLVTPGPTNTLIALAGAERGWRPALPLIWAEIAGYLAVVLPLALVGQALLESVPVLRTIISLAAALWVLWLALRMWWLPIAEPGDETESGVSAGAVFVTTLLNPKALIFGLVLVPAQSIAGLAVHLGLFVAEIAIVATGWAALGAALAPAQAPAGRATSPGLPGWLRRSAALWLAAVAMWLAARGTGLVA